MINKEINLMKLNVVIVAVLFLLFTTSALYAKIPSVRQAESAFSELKIYDANGYPWRTVREDWDIARQRVSSDAGWQEWLQKQRKIVDAWMTKFPTDRADWACGRLSRFISPKDSSSLTWTEQVPGEEIDCFHSETDPKVEITPTLMGAWVYQFRSRNIRMLPDAARLYRLTGEKKYADWVVRQIQYYTDNYEKWPLSPNRDEKTGKTDGTRLFYTGLDTAVQMFYFEEAIRVLGDYVSPETKKDWNENFFRHDTNALVNHWFNTKVSNITVWQMSAIALSGLMFNDEDLWKTGLAGVRHQLAEGVTKDYIWNEQTFGYNKYVVIALQKLFYAADMYGKGRELDREKNIAFNLVLSPLYVRCPDGTLPATADTSRTALPSPDQPFMMSLYRMFPTVIGLEEAAKERTWDSLLETPLAPPKDVCSLPEVTSRNLKSTYMAQLKHGPWQVFFHYGQNSANHAQDEILNYSVFYNDTDILHNCGTWKYGSPLHGEYFTRAPSHNIPLINGEGQQTRPMKGKMTKFSTEPPAMSAVFRNFQPNTTAWRTLEIKDGNLVDTVKIETKSPDAALGLPIHLQGKVQLPSGFQSYSDESFIKAHPLPFKYWKDIQYAEYTDSAEFVVDYSGFPMRVTISVPGKFTVWYASTPDVPVPIRRDTLYAEVAGQKNATFTTTFVPGIK